MKSSWTIEDWGLLAYQEALARQEALVQKVADSESSGVIVFCTHPPVVTRGSKTRLEDIFAWNGEVVDVSRGGRATYHGPNQLICYPILSLDRFPEPRPKRDIAWYLRSLEDSLVRTLRHFGIDSRGKIPGQGKVDLEDTGVWVNEQKLASVGVGVRRWVTYHGVALNVGNDPKAFAGLNPCGYQPSVMTSVEKILGKPVDRASLQNLWQKELENLIFNP